MTTTKDPIADIGLRLLAARHAAGLTQTQVGEMSGTNQAVIQKVENGNSMRPRALVAIAKAVNVNPAWLQFGEPYAQRERPKGT